MDLELPADHGYNRDRCAQLNDELRKYGPRRAQDGIFISEALRYHMEEHENLMSAQAQRLELNRQIATYDFDADVGNDPYGERDMAFFDFLGERICFKIDYYDLDRLFGSDDPANPEITSRVMTIMLASDY